MLVNKILALIFGGVVVTTTPIEMPAVGLDEILTFECAKHVIGLIPVDYQQGPVFHRDGLVFTSINAANGDKILIVNAGSGTFSIPLAGTGVNRLSFTIPARIQGDMNTYYLAYLHGGSRNSRFYEFSSGKAPPGKDEIDFQTTNPKRAGTLLPYLEYAIFETIESTLTLLTDKKIERHQLGIIRPESCDHISRQSPALARNIRYDLTVIAAIVKGPKPQPKFNVAARASGSGRMPASIAASKLFKN